ncbi:helix-turn-helix transcriptional regulator [Vibrio harveyi]|uniref:helix-turn-helix transcriptional regulator n=1 Tax=Vibrio harveyi TaxID=669 RepID=UPI003CE93A3C
MLGNHQPQTILDFVSMEEMQSLFGSRRSIYDQINDGRLPKPLNPYGNRRMWPKSEILELQRAILLGYTKQQIKDLVITLSDKRKVLAESLVSPLNQKVGEAK